MDQALNSQKTPHTSPLRASYGMSFVSILMKNDRVIKGFYCMYMTWINMIELKSQGNSITTINHFNRLDGLCIAMAFIDDVVKVQSLKLSGIAFQEL